MFRGRPPGTTQTPEPAQDVDVKPGPGGFGWIVFGIFVPLLYALSVGPVAAVTSNKPPSTQAVVRSIYFPVIWLHNHTPLKKPIEAYARLWGVR